MSSKSLGTRATVTAVGAPVKKPTPRWVLPAALAAVVLVPIIEIVLLIVTGRTIGVGWTLLVLLAEAALGAWLLKREGSKAWRQLREAVKAGRMPENELLDAVLVGAGGVMLMLPGFLTDIIGIACLLPWTRRLLRQALVWVVQRRIAKKLQAVNPFLRRDGIIEGVVVDNPVQPPAEDGAHVVIKGQIER